MPVENMELWNKLNRPPAEALKQIGGGRLKGMTDITPQWRYQAMTEQFGPIGVGWYYEPVREWTEPGPEGQVFCFVSIALYTIGDGCKSQPIYGIGGSMLVKKETGGLHANDEAFKMATTDALSVAMSRLGVAADIYMGLWDGSKYSNKPTPAGNGTQPQSEKPSEHYCQYHEVDLFKKGRMKNFAHPLPDGSWCEGRNKEVDDPNKLRTCDICRTSAILHQSGTNMICDECAPPVIAWESMAGKGE